MEKKFNLELLEKNVKEKNLKIDLCGHFSSDMLEQVYLFDSIYQDITYAIESERNYVKIINETYKKEGKEPFEFCRDHFSVNSHMVCTNCGDNLYAYCEDEENVTLRTRISSGSFGKGDFKSAMIKKECIMKDGLKPKETTVNFKTNEIVFTDYFRSEDDFLLKLPEDVDYGQEYSLQSHLGRQNLMNFYAKEMNVGFSQMGNMSIKILISENKDHILIVEPYFEDYEEGDHKEEDYQKFIDNGYTDLGDVSLSMWRWMCIENQTLTDKKVIMGGEDDYNDYVHAEIKTGDWKITHYYDNMKDPKNSLFIYSEMKLV